MTHRPASTRPLGHKPHNSQPPIHATTNVTFTFCCPAGVQRVALVGTFNNWDPEATPMTGPDESGVFSVSVPLEPGIYHYKFVTNGTTWHHDPKAKCVAPDGFGGQNSVLIIPEPGLNAAGEIAVASEADATVDCETAVLGDLDLPWTHVTPHPGPFRTPEWVHHAVFYQIFPDRFYNGDPHNDPPVKAPWGAPPTLHNFFGGDLEGIIQKIPYLKSLGITAVWLNPIFAAGTNHKYDTRDYLQVDPHFGDEAKLRELITKLHAAGIRLILDGVFNHTGVDFWAFRDIREKGPRSRYWNWYHVYDWPVRKDPPNYEAWWGIGDLPKLNHANPEVRAYLLRVARYWLSVGIDGWRLDVPNEMPHDFWQQFRSLIKSINPDAYIVGEIWHEAEAWLRGDQFDAVMNYPFRDAVLRFFVEDSHKAATPSEFNEAVTRLLRLYPQPAVLSQLNLVGSHDTERILTLAKLDRRRVMLAALFQMTYPGAPLVYYGDEVGLEGGRDPDDRRTFPWHPADQHLDLLNWYRTIIHMRHRHRALRDGAFETLVTDDPQRVYAYARSNRDERIIVAMNVSEQAAKVQLTPSQLDNVAQGRTAVDLLSGRHMDPRAFTLPPRSAVVLTTPICAVNTLSA